MFEKWNRHEGLNITLVDNTGFELSSFREKFPNYSYIQTNRGPFRLGTEGEIDTIKVFPEKLKTKSGDHNIEGKCSLLRAKHNFLLQSIKAKPTIDVWCLLREQLTFADTRVVAAKKWLWDDFIKNVDKKLISDGVILETLLSKYILTSLANGEAKWSNFDCSPSIDGVSGTTGKRYGFCKQSIIKPILTRYIIKHYHELFRQKVLPLPPPSEDVRTKYPDCFSGGQQISVPVSKTIFDKLCALIAIALYVIPISILYVIYLIECLSIKDSRGPFLYYYWAISKGKKFKKYKIRSLKMSSIDPELAKENLWEAYCLDKEEGTTTYTGKLAKKYYLDEFPQFFDVLFGRLSIVGPRPLSKIHFQEDVKNGNTVRKFLTAGLIGNGHIHKGTHKMGDPEPEYEYFNRMISGNNWEILKLDLWILYKSILLIIKGGGH